MTERADQFITRMRLAILQLSCRHFWQSTTSPRSVSPPLQPRFGPLRLLAFLKDKIAFEREEICECDCHTVHKLNQQRLTADWLALRKSDCSRLRSKVSSDWLPSYIKATRPVLQIFKMDRYSPDSASMIQSDENSVWWLGYSWFDSRQSKYIFLSSTWSRTPL